MDVARPMLDVIPGVRGAVLAALARLREPATGRQVERAAGQPHTSAARVLDDLVDAGLVLRTIIGRDNTYRLNPDHLATPAIHALADLRGVLVDRLRDAISRHPAILAAWLFGSTARGDGNRRSDIDLLIVHDVPGDQGALANELAVATRAWTGNPVQIVEHSVGTFSALVGDGNALIEAIYRDGIALTEASNSLLAHVP